jgi:IclR family acetate operon transcriptional repressor
MIASISAACQTKNDVSATKGQFVSTVDKALDVLSLFSETRPSIGLSEAARLTRRDKATVQRYLSALEAQGFLEQDALSRAYHLGPAVTRLAVVRELTYPIETAVKNVISKLVMDTGETSHVSHYQLGGLNTLCIVETATRNTRVYVDPSELLPLHVTASGIAYLSRLPLKLAEKLMRGAFGSGPSKSRVTYESAMDAMQLATERGYAVAHATFDYDVVGMAAPLIAASGDVCGAVAVATPTTRFNAETEARHAKFLQPAAEKISRIYGARTAGLYCAAE